MTETEFEQWLAEKEHEHTLIANGQCPKCEGKNVKIVGYDGAGGYGYGGVWQETSWTNYRCLDCETRFSAD